MAHEFALEEKKDLENNNKLVKYIIVFFLLVVAIILFLIIKNNFFLVEKMDDSRDYIYTKKTLKNKTRFESTYDNIPYVNLKSNDAKKVNEEIESNYNLLLNKDEYDYNYEFNKSGNILSLKITTTYFINPNDSEATVDFDTYNFSLKTGNLISDASLLSIYGMDVSTLNKNIENIFKGYYNDLVNLDYYKEKSCSYECFLKNRGITKSYTDNVYLYTKGNSLVMYKFYYKNSEYEEEYYLIDNTYEFLLKKNKTIKYKLFMIK